MALPDGRRIGKEGSIKTAKVFLGRGRRKTERENKGDEKLSFK